MKFCYVFVAVLVAASAQDYQPDYENIDPYPIVTDSYPGWYVKLSQQDENRGRHTRDLTYTHKTPNGNLFSSLGSTDFGLYGKAGYQHNFMNDHRGVLMGEAYGTRTITPYGSGTSASGAMHWIGSNSAGSIDVTKDIGGRTTLGSAGGAAWPLGKNGYVGLQGTLTKTEGLPTNVGVQGGLHYRF